MCLFHSPGRNNVVFNCCKERHFDIKPVQKKKCLKEKKNKKSKRQSREQNNGEVNPSIKERSTFYLSDCTILKEQCKEKKLPTNESDPTIFQSWKRDGREHDEQHCLGYNTGIKCPILKAQKRTFQHLRAGTAASGLS